MSSQKLSETDLTDLGRIAIDVREASELLARLQTMLARLSEKALKVCEQSAREREAEREAERQNDLTRGIELGHEVGLYPPVYELYRRLLAACADEETAQDLFKRTMNDARDSALDDLGEKR